MLTLARRIMRRGAQSALRDYFSRPSGWERGHRGLTESWAGAGHCAPGQGGAARSEDWTQARSKGGGREEGLVKRKGEPGAA